MIQVIFRSVAASFVLLIGFHLPVFSQTLYVPSGTSGIGSSSNGNVGIGTPSASSKLQVMGSGGAQLDFVVNGRIKTGDSNHLGGMVMNAEESMFIGQSSSTSMGLYNGDWRLVANNLGNVGIGTMNPDQKLTVNGTVHATRVKVEATVPGPDYVFEKDYALPSLDQIKSYIDENKHLPDVPSAKEMEAKGIDVGEMNLLLLKKIEEMTLLMIQQQEKMNRMQEEIDLVKQNIKD